jgi:hypothetical protein
VLKLLLEAVLLLLLLTLGRVAVCIACLFELVFLFIVDELLRFTVAALLRVDDDCVLLLVRWLPDVAVLPVVSF